MWAAWRAEFFGNVRMTFIVLLGLTIYVFIANHQLQIEMAASRDIHRAFKHVTMADKLKKRAMAYQATVDSVNEPVQTGTDQSSQPAQPAPSSQQ
jgi:energy-converting hydrogenase Eha subunit H